MGLPGFAQKGPSYSFLTLLVSQVEQGALKLYHTRGGAQWENLQGIHRGILGLKERDQARKRESGNMSSLAKSFSSKEPRTDAEKRKPECH